MKTGSKHNIKRTMRDLITENGFATYNGNATALAEDAADRLGSLEWLDDETHVIWDCAVEVELGYSALPDPESVD